jgi:hypothetical protein
MDLILKGKCYVVHQLKQVAHPITKYRHDLLWHPERGMGLLDRASYRPYVQSIVTDSPWLIACYDREDVFVWEKDGRKKGRWVHPNAQTYGADIDSITFTVLGITHPLPAMALDGGKIMKKYIKQLEREYRDK